MSSLVSLSIDVTKINKEKLVKGRYLNLTLSVNDEVNQYGQNVSAFHSQSAEEREIKTPKEYLGNGKVIWTNGLIVKAEQQENNFPQSDVSNEGEDDLPW